MKIIWSMVPETWRVTEFLSFWASFCCFNTLTTQKLKLLKKWKKTSGDIFILHKCTINDNHMMYGFWDMKHDKQNFLSFWVICCPFTPLKFWKNPGDIVILQKCAKNHDHMLYCSWDMARDECNFYCSFSAVFCPFTPPPHPTLTALNMKIE